MSYVSDLDDLKNRFEDADAVTSITDGKGDAYLTTVLEDTSVFMDSYIGKRYATPVDTTTNATAASVLKKINLDLAHHQLVVRNRNDSTEGVQNMKDEAITWLEGIAKGTFVLPGAVSVATASRNPLVSWGTGDAIRPTSSRVFTRGSQGQL